MINKHVSMQCANTNLVLWKQKRGKMLGDELMNCSFHH